MDLDPYNLCVVYDESVLTKTNELCLSGFKNL